MSLTKRDYEKLSPNPDRVGAILKLFVILLRPLFWMVELFGPARRALGRSVGGRVGAISHFAKRGDHKKAVAVAIDALKDYRHESINTAIPTGRESWWVFMTFAVDSLKTYDDPDTWDELIEMARNGVEPFEGYHVAQSYLAFSLSKFRAREYDAALEFAQTAACADATWGEIDYVRGWYCLALGNGDALAYFTEAIRKDRGILFRIASDPLCRQHPHIMQRLKEFSAAEMEAGRG